MSKKPFEIKLLQSWGSGNPKAYYSAWGKFKPAVGKSTLSKRVDGYEIPSQPALQKSVEASILSYAEMVAQYTMRELTYPSDGLNAFRGAANALTEFNPPVYNVAGIPFVVYGDDEDSLTEATFSYGLSWRSLALSGNKLDACSDVPSSEFPSWSWGDVRKWCVSWTSHDDDLNHRLAASAIGYPRSVHIEFNAHGHKDLVHLADFAEAYRASPQRSQRDPTALCFKARLLPLRSKVHHTPSGISSGIPSGLYHKPGTANEAFYGFLGDHGNDSGHNCLILLLVKPKYTPDGEQSERSTRACEVDGSQRSCEGFMSDKRLYEKLVSGSCSLMLLRCDSEQAQVLVVEWQDVPCEPQKTARRIGIVEFKMLGRPESADIFLSCFSIETHLRLI